ATLALPAIDLPISRTGVLLYHPPLFKLTPEPGAFRTETYEAPSSAALVTAAFGAEYGRSAGGLVNTNGAAGFTSNGLRGRDNEINGQNNNDNRAIYNPQSATQTLVDNYKTKTLGGRGAKVLPIRPAFPAFGPTMFFVSELTAENHAPTLAFDYQREKKEGSK
ncbi:MAG TPA: hypothetical protein VKQ89_02870, partial [Candidatus Angelobacter sp.]|nr:hypothetical protein [Candidatus Angelobacter sp.]